VIVPKVISIVVKVLIQQHDIDMKHEDEDRVHLQISNLQPFPQFKEIFPSLKKSDTGRNTFSFSPEQLS